MATGVALVLALAAIGWVQWRQVQLLSGTVRYEGDNLVWSFFQVESELLQLRDVLREAVLEPANPAPAALTERVRHRFELFASRLPLVEPQRVAHLIDFGQDHVQVMAALNAFVRKHDPLLAEAATQPLTQQASAAARAGLVALLGPLGALTLRANRRIAEDVGITFCFAAAFHPALRHAAVPRRELGIGTTFNILGPLANPIAPQAQAIGCARCCPPSRLGREARFRHQAADRCRRTGGASG